MTDDLELDFGELDALVESSTKNEITDLISKIKAASQAYHSNGTSGVSDKVWDSWIERLTALDPTNVLLEETGNGYELELDEDVDENEKIEHPIIVSSIVKTKKPSDIIAKIGKKSTFSVKLDGNSIVAYYKYGKLDKILTRGTNNIGIDRTIKFINIIPVIIGNKLPYLAVRGEAVIAKENYTEANGFDINKSSRNTVAGLINKKDDWEKDFKWIEFIAYTFVDVSTKKDIYESYDWSKDFNVEQQKPCKLFLDMDINDFYEQYKLNWKYDADGTVFKFDNGSMLALKYLDEAANTDLSRIVWKIGIDQRLTPIAILKPVKLSGALISKASLGSFDRVNNKLHLWPVPLQANVDVIRANEIIPYVTNVTNRSISTLFGNTPICPSCGKESEIIGKHAYCMNPECPNIDKSRLLKFASFFYPDGVSDKQIIKIFDAYKIKTIPQLLEFKYQKIDFARIDGVGQSLAILMGMFFHKLSGDIDSKIVYQSVALGCGNSSAKAIVKLGVPINRIWLTSGWITTIKGISGFNSKIADSIWKNRHLIAEICRLRNVVDDKPKNIVGTYCMTQIRFNKDQIDELSKLGWIEDNTVKKTTTVLITNDIDGGSTKMDKARKYGIDIVETDAFFEKYINKEGELDD